MLDSRQIAEWYAFYKTEPFGYDAEWLRAGVISSVMANTHRVKSAKAYKPEDFMPQPLKLDKKQTVEEQKTELDNILNWAKQFNKVKK